MSSIFYQSNSACVFWCDFLFIFDISSTSYDKLPSRSIKCLFIDTIYCLLLHAHSTLLSSSSYPYIMSHAALGHTLLWNRASDYNQIFLFSPCVCLIWVLRKSSTAWMVILLLIMHLILMHTVSLMLIVIYHTCCNFALPGFILFNQFLALKAAEITFYMSINMLYYS